MKKEDEMGAKKVVALVFAWAVMSAFIWYAFEADNQIMEAQAMGTDGQYETRVRPNTCASETALAQYEPCVYPNKCDVEVK